VLRTLAVCSQWFQEDDVLLQLSAPHSLEITHIFSFYLTEMSPSLTNLSPNYPSPGTPPFHCLQHNLLTHVTQCTNGSFFGEY
jgi:hypothetical protein